MTNPEQLGDSPELRAFAKSVEALAGSVAAAASYGQRTRRLIRWTIIGLVIVAVLAVGVGVLFYNQQATNHRIGQVLHSDCPFFKDLGTVALPKQASTFGIKIVADSRAAYYIHGCVAVSGTLGRPDPRLLPYLPPNAR